MHRPVDQDELKKIVEGVRTALNRAAPVFMAAMDQFKMAAENLKMSLQIFGTELNESMETWLEHNDRCPGCGNPLSEGGHGNGGEFGGCV